MKASPASRPVAPVRRAARLGWHIAAGLGLVVVLGVAFWGYLTPDMVLNWESVASLCGF